MGAPPWLCGCGRCRSSGALGPRELLVPFGDIKFVLSSIVFELPPGSDWIVMVMLGIIMLGCGITATAASWLDAFCGAAKVFMSAIMPLDSMPRPPPPTVELSGTIGIGGPPSTDTPTMPSTFGLPSIMNDIGGADLSPTIIGLAVGFRGP